MVVRKRVMTVNASFLNRGLALILDLFIVNLIVLFPFHGLFTRVVPHDSIASTFRFITQGNLPQSLVITFTVVNMVMTFLYFFLLERKIGQTPGKILMNLRVVHVESRAQPNTMLRTVLFVLVLHFTFVAIIDIGYALFNEHNQRLGEFLSKTKVVENMKW
jgi:uncharacterized RDD family membrane protein YckC